MVVFNPSTGTKAITITQVEVNTSTVIMAPTEQDAGDAFPVSGRLTRTDTGAGINGETITVSYNGVALGTTTTFTEGGVPGMWTLGWVTIDAPGTYTLKAQFAGSTRAGLALGASSGTSRIGIGVPSALPMLALLGIIAYTVLK